MIETIWQWHVDAGGNLQGFIFGMVACIIMGGVLLYTLIPHRKKEISDEDFFNIVLDDEHEIHKAMDKDDDYS